MTKDELSALPDWAIAVLYSEWTEENYRAGWMTGVEDGFVADCLAGRYPYHRMEETYEQESIAKIREIVKEMQA